MPNVQGYKFVVEGRHEFPFDMLRFDRCWPAAEAEIPNLAPYVRSEKYQQVRQVTLRGLNEPTDGRWSSFGWKVVNFDRISLSL